MTDRSTMRAEAVEAMAAPVVDCWMMYDQRGVSCTAHEDWFAAHNDADGDALAFMRHLTGLALDALLSPRTEPCGECGGTGAGRTVSVCESCNGTGEVSSPPLAVLMGELEQVGKALRAGGANVNTDSMEPGEPLYRIASGESSPNTGPKEQR